MKQKKALIFSISLVFIALAAFIALMLVLTKIQNTIDPVRTIGERSIELLNSKAETDKILFFVDEAAKISAEKALKKLQYSSGLLDITLCGILSRPEKAYIYWNQIDKNCFETNFYENYQTLFNREMNDYLELFAQQIPLDNYDILIQDGKSLSGIALSPLQITHYLPRNKEEFEKNPKGRTFIGQANTAAILFEAMNPLFTYTIKPSFTIQFKHDFSALNKAKQFAREILNEATGCKDKTKEEASNCVQTFANEYNIALLNTQDNNFVLQTPEPFKTEFALVIPMKEEETEK